MPEVTTSTSNSSSRGSQRSTFSIWKGLDRSCTTAAVICILFIGQGVCLHDAAAGVGEIGGRLGAGDGELAIEDEHRHAADAGFLGRLRLLLDLSDVLVAIQIAATPPSLRA